MFSTIQLCYSLTAQVFFFIYHLQAFGYFDFWDLNSDFIPTEKTIMAHNNYSLKICEPNKNDKVYLYVVRPDNTN